jgi:hypothetical protein
MGSLEYGIIELEEDNNPFQKKLTICMKKLER